MQWYYSDMGQQAGPVSEDDFAQLVAAGKITAATLVWHEGMPDWASYGTVAGPSADAASADAETQTSVTCCQCRRSFSPQDVILYEDVHVCAECKPVFFQRLQEGAPPVQEGGEGRTPNVEIMTAALSGLQGNWGTAIGVCIVYWLITMAIGAIGAVTGSAVPFAGNIVQLLLVPPLTLGITAFFVMFTRNFEPDFGLLFSGFSRYGISILAYFLRNVVVGLCAGAAIMPGAILLVMGGTQESPALIVLGSLLLVPGFVVAIVISYMFAMTFFVLADDQAVSASDALKRSRTMMKGMKWKLFCLNLRFLGWSLLCLLTLGIGFIWLAPYMTSSMAIFYHDVKGRIWVVQ